MIDIQLSEPQALAFVETVDRGGLPADGRQRAALQRARDRIAAALDTRRSIPEHAYDCDALSDALSGVGRADFVALMRLRLRDLARVVDLWSAAERLDDQARARLLDPDTIDDFDWRAEVLDALDAAGIAVESTGPVQPRR